MSVFCAAADWGTTSFRLWLLARDGAVLGESRGDDGILSVESGAYPGVLASHLARAGAPAGCPVIVCGMAGARQGWIEAPYADTPANLVSLCDGAIQAGMPGHDVRIIPGVAQRATMRPDVMRGEETQLLGLGKADALVCVPGTHSKWVSMSGGALVGFGTFMTGEVFSVLSEHSILRHSAAQRDFEGTDPAFLSGLDAALQAGASLLQLLFSVRARGLVDEDDGQGAAYLSGLLIGSEVAAARGSFGPEREVTLLASGLLADIYEIALEKAGMMTIRADAETAARAGLLAVAEKIWEA